MLTVNAGSERGQLLVLFVVAFSIIVAFAGFAIDQGFWYGRHTITQKDADTSARAGAIALLDQGQSWDYDPCEHAALTAERNGVPFTDSNPDDDNVDCTAAVNPDVSFDTSNSCLSNKGMPSMSVSISGDQPGLFSRAFGIQKISVGAQATACVGSVTTLRADLRTKSDAANEALPLVLRSRNANSGSCFDNAGALKYGTECVIYGALNANNRYGERMYASVPLANQCFGSGNPSILAVANGTNFTCTVNGNCNAGGRQTQCVNVATVCDQCLQDQHQMFQSLTTWLQRASICDNGSRSYTFQNSFGFANGFPDQVPVPPQIPVQGGGGVNVPDQSTKVTYVEKDCRHNPRVVVLPITDSNGNSSTKRVTGFATVYITGCYRTGTNHPSGNNASAQVQTEDCATAAGIDPDPPNPKHLPLCDITNNLCDYEVRGIPIATYILDGALDFGNTNIASPLTIQTVK